MMHWDKSQRKSLFVHLVCKQSQRISTGNNVHKCGTTTTKALPPPHVLPQLRRWGIQRRASPGGLDRLGENDLSHA